VIDAHHHFWDPDNATYPWMTGPYEPLRRKYAPGDLAPELEACGVDATIVVQSRHDLGETRQLLSIAAGTPWIEGVVGWVDLTDPDVSSTITSMREEAAGSYLVGIRHLVHDEPDEEWLLRPDVTIGLQAVEDAGLTFDLLVRSREIPSAVQVARRFPGLRFILDHLGKPLVSTGDLEPWTSLVSGFRELDNVSCKVSGLVTEAVWTSWEQSDLAPYVRTALDVFGSDRLMFGSDWPVCLMAGTYLEVYEAAVTTLRDLLGNDLESVLGGCAARVYFKG
jgi:L-fuconolactonase